MTAQQSVQPIDAGLSLLQLLCTHDLFIMSRPSSGAEPKARNMRQMKEAPSRVRTPVLSGGTSKNRLPTMRPMTTICRATQDGDVKGDNGYEWGEQAHDGFCWRLTALTVYYTPMY